jgi:hypothetical protein
MDPDPQSGYGSPNPIESGSVDPFESGSNPDPKHYGSGIRDGKNSDLGFGMEKNFVSGINIPDLQH